jgi:hypothetical protein
MTATQWLRGIRRAGSRLEHTEELRRSAMGDLRESIRAAQAGGLFIARIAREAELSPRRVRDLLAGRVVRDERHRISNATAANRNQEK